MSGATTATTAGPATLQRRLARLLAAAGALLALVIVLEEFTLDRLFDHQHRLTGQAFEAVVETDANMLALVDAETGLRGYALTGERATLEPYDRARTREVTFASIARGLDGFGADAGLASSAAAADAATDRWFTGYAQPFVARVDADGPGAVDAASIEQGKASFDEVRTEVAAFTAQVRSVRDDEAAALQRWTAAAIGLAVVLVLVFVAAGVLLWVALRRWVVAPVAALAAESRAVASGDLRRSVTATGPGELVELGRDVEAMRRSLVAQVTELESSRAEIAEQHDRLAAQTQELERSNRDLEQFAYVASHDLQEPLRKISSFTQLLKKRYGGQLDERADQYIDFAVDGAKRMQQLISDLLGFSRVGRLGGEVTDVPLERALGRALENLEDAIEESGAVVTHGPLPVVRGEEPLLVQLLQNLVGNAVKFARPGTAAHVHLEARRGEDGLWQLECRDDGIGIDPQYADRVFVIFQRLHAKDVYEGTGIGLALCKKIVEFHGGQIWIPPTDGVGTTIRWTLPPADAAGAPTDTPTARKADALP